MSAATSPADSRPSGEPKTRCTTAASNTPVAKLARTATGSPDCDTTVATASSAIVTRMIRWIHRPKYGSAALATATVAATLATGNAKANPSGAPLDGRPPVAPRRAPIPTHTSHAPTPAKRQSLTTLHWREISASRTMATISPIEPPHQIEVTNHRIPSGAGVTARMIARSPDELMRVANQHRTITRRQIPTRTPSLPRLRRWPSPTGANRIARHQLRIRRFW